MGNEFKGMWGKEKTFFNPNFNFSSTQLAPYTVSGSFDGDLKVNLSRDSSDSNPLGYSMGMDISADKFTLAPSINYLIADGIRLSSSMSFDSEYECKLAIGVAYEFS